MSSGTHKLGTFEGVFVPTAMTILGVILFVRTGWIVGHVGLAGALAVIVGAFAISTATALSLASVVTNVRVDAGGAFALLTRTLGIEPGGSIGLPLYLSQSLAIALYLFGFREGWLRIFPDHPALWIDLGAFLAVFAVAAVSARFAFRLQFVVLGLIALAVASVGAGLSTELQPITWWEPGHSDLLGAFSVFFPAVTGIMAGVNMSGELATPRESIVRGSLAAIAVTFVVYVGVAVSAALLVDPGTLRTSDTALLNGARWELPVLGGLLAATFSSALSTAVGAPRILQALGNHGVVPGGSWLAEPGWGNQPHRAMGFTALVVLGGIALRDLNAIAPMITLFFLLTYAAINGTLLVQQGLELPRFRPTFRVPLVVPLVGTVGCVGGMLAISPSFTVAAMATVGGMYAWLARRKPEGPYGQVRAGMVVGLFAWVVGKLSEVPDNRAWQAHVLVPVGDRTEAEGLVPLIRTLVRRGGSVGLLALDDPEPLRDLEAELRESGLVARLGRAAGDDRVESVVRAIDVMGAGLFRPNLLLVPLPPRDQTWSGPEALGRLEDRARRAGLGLWLAETGVEHREDGDTDGPPWPRLEVWVDAEALSLSLATPALALVLLAGWRVSNAYGIPARFTVVHAGEGREAARRSLERMAEQARIPDLETRVVDEGLGACLERCDEALHLAVLSQTDDPERIARLREARSGQLILAVLSGRSTPES